jgi:hypothetical protein
MSKQLSIATAIVEKETEQQKNCKHQFITVSSFDFEHDEVYYLGVCRRCGLKTE